MSAFFVVAAASVMAFAAGVIVGGDMMVGSITKDCRTLSAFQWREQAYDCSARPNTQTEQERP